MFTTLVRKGMAAAGLLLVFAVLASPALAQNQNGGNQNGGNQNGKKAPEIDPASAVSGVTLLSGGLLLLADSRRRKQ